MGGGEGVKGDGVRGGRVAGVVPGRGGRRGPGQEWCREGRRGPGQEWCREGKGAGRSRARAGREEGPGFSGARRNGDPSAAPRCRRQRSGSATKSRRRQLTTWDPMQPTRGVRSRRGLRSRTERNSRLAVSTLAEIDIGLGIRAQFAPHQRFSDRDANPPRYPRQMSISRNPLTPRRESLSVPARRGPDSACPRPRPL
jgi:hypothetical protein